ncbi:alkaline phosphatase family protein [bacterium]|nr:alkaline phosphatase family protein [bacterium]
MLTLLFWPIRFIYRLITGKLRAKVSEIDRLIIVGFDGMEPSLARKWIAEGKLPNLASLADKGTFTPLRTTFPAISPVAWSTFSTGVNPGKHNIYDFLSRNPLTYLPDLSSARIGVSTRSIKLGKYQIPIGKPDIRLLRKSKPFWKILGERGLFSHILRVPITFPPEKFNGVSLSAMCVPDLLGSQGTFTFYSSEPDRKHRTGGMQVSVEVNNGRVQTHLIGPTNSLLVEPKPMEIPFSVELDAAGQSALVQLPDKKVTLKLGEYSDWINVTFRPLLWIKVHGECRFLLKEVRPHFKLYVTPINIDPERPALPISHPFIYAPYLSKMQGAYATLGLAEDTWALNENIIDDADFLEQCYRYHDEREKMFFNALERTRQGVCACVFDTTDRVQHMFFRYLDPDHPALRGQDRTAYQDVVEKLYQHCDDLVGRVMAQLTEKDVLLIMSDHGFRSFARGINLNTWLHQNGYLSLKNGDRGSGEWFENVDWSKTSAYNLGLGGIYLNVAGRENHGIVTREQVPVLKAELIAKLNGLIDTDTGAVSIERVYDTAVIYKGPYLHNAPDLIIGYGNGYRASWDGVTGIVGEKVFMDNTRKWSGDHCVDPEMVPGVIFSSRKIDKKDPSIADIAPTALSLFHVPIPAYMDGQPLFNSGTGMPSNQASEQAEKSERACIEVT